ncbi:hypothetical protein H480_07353 [Amycolatopsis vancoresmycina DSM 44592]|uniref:Uncharacterized protein n=1 Tax=Amycolatopsis vancoresmycina DSM 44592 TaxID=1292037 RepID=R1I076_9PSEU|nr:hypothetical protein H480_07353 [Amycolatopsis vancoresmycina DSM 44592]
MVTGDGSLSPVAVTSLSRLTPSGRRTSPGLPTGRTWPVTRESRKQRVAPRSRSCPTTYQRARHDTTPHGSRVRMIRSGEPLRRYSNRTAWPFCTAASSGPNAGSARTRGSTTVGAWSSTSRPAARSFTSAPCACPVSSGESHSRDASATAAASSGARSISPSS